MTAAHALASHAEQPAMTHHHLALLGIVLALGLSRPAPGLAAEDTIGYVNLQRAIVEVEDGKRAKAKLEAAFKEKQSALREKEEELESMKKRLEAANIDRDDPKARAQLLEFQKKFLSLRERLLKEQQELKQLEGEALSAITKKLRKIIEEVGKKGGYTLIMEMSESSLLFAKPHLDLTNEVIRKYNARHSRSKK